MLNNVIKFFLENKLITVLLTISLVAWGIATAPFNWNIFLPQDPVPVDAIPDLGENQQIVFTEWKGRSPQDIEDQITYPLTTALLGMPGVKTIRSSSIFGLSSIYIIFDESIEFYWSRSRILEKLNSLPTGTLPADAQPALGPDATALGQIYWYTLEGRNPETGKPAGGWDPQELRSLQDFYVKYGLSSSEGVAEVASIGGFVKEYQVDIDPAAMKTNKVTVAQIMNSVRESNLDIGARTIEFNRAEYLVRGLGYIKNLEDIEESVVAVNDNVPIRIKDVARVQFGPATRRGGLDKAGAEATGGVVVARYGSNPLEVIDNVKAKIAEISPGLPSKVLDDGTVSKVTIVPFYDRTGLIKETLGTLEEALTLEILISIIVVIVLILNLRASVLISSILPLGVLITFIVMRYTGVDANIVALSGIAIAIGVMVDVGVVFTENMVRHLEKPENADKPKIRVIYEATIEVASAVITALATTIISFLPVFALQAQEGKLFRPLAFTKTYAIIAALIVGIVVIPAFAHWILTWKVGRQRSHLTWNMVMLISGIALLFMMPMAGIILVLLALKNLFQHRIPSQFQPYTKYFTAILVLLGVILVLTREWLPLGAGSTYFGNLIFVILAIGIVLAILMLVVKFYSSVLRWCLDHKAVFFTVPILILLWGLLSWQGFNSIFGFVARGAGLVGWDLRQTEFWGSLSGTFPGVGKEFMPPLDEGSFLLMPTTMPHSGVEENIEVIRLLDKRVTDIPEVDMTVGKWGRVASALDPAPISMFENVINYKSEYVLDENGHRVRFETDKEGRFILSNGWKYKHQKGTFLNENDEEVIAGDQGFDAIKQNILQYLVPDSDGDYFRQWRDHIQSPDDIWEEIVSTTRIPGLTSAPKLQPIQTRLIMLSTGMRAPMGIKVFGPDLTTIESVGLRLENLLQQVPGIKASSVFADRVVGKPYLQIDIDRQAIARYGLTIKDLQTYIGVAVGGVPQTTTVEGRERYPVRVRYAREFRDNPDDLQGILIPSPTGVQVPLGELAEITYTRGPQMVKSENTFLVSYVIFDKNDGYAEVDVVEQAQEYLQSQIAAGNFELPPNVSYQFTGNYENQVRAAKRLSIVIPISLLAILLILYFQFGNLQSTGMVFSGIFVAFAGGFILIWLYGQEWFLDFDFLGANMRDLFQVHPINLSVAVWVGFIALFGIATDDGVLMGTYLKQVFASHQPETRKEVRAAVLQAGLQRVRPAMITTATTVIALMPVLTSTGKGSDIMVPMAIPIFGGMLIQMITMFVVPVAYSWWQERRVSQ